MLTSCKDKTVAFNISDLDINLSDHLPIMSVCTHDLTSASVNCSAEAKPAAEVTHLRWHYARLDAYYEYTRQQLQPILSKLDTITFNSLSMDIAAIICV